jgi:hypothetical protein
MAAVIAAFVINDLREFECVIGCDFVNGEW